MTLVVSVGVDGSRESLAAAHWAACEAEARDAALRVLHAWILPGPATDSKGRDRSRSARQTVDDAVHAIEDRHPGLNVHGELIAAEPVTALLDAAQESDVLVLGSQAMGAIASYLLGALSLQVLARTPVPTVLVRAEELERSSPEAAQPQDVVVGTVLSEPVDELLAFAFASAARHGWGLRAVHCHRPTAAYASAPVGITVDAQAHEEGRHAEQQLKQLLKLWQDRFPEVRVHGTVSAESAARVLVRESGDAALLVLGRTRNPPPLTPRLGHVVQAAAHHAACPVAVVPHG